LVTLDCTKNSLKELDISNLKNLEFVSCKENLINKINASNSKNLEFLDSSNHHYLFYSSSDRQVLKLEGVDKLEKLFLCRACPD